jgi:hypothetical protein
MHENERGRSPASQATFAPVQDSECHRDGAAPPRPGRPGAARRAQPCHSGTATVPVAGRSADAFRRTRSRVHRSFRAQHPRRARGVQGVASRGFRVPEAPQHVAASNCTVCTPTPLDCAGRTAACTRPPAAAPRKKALEHAQGAWVGHGSLRGAGPWPTAAAARTGVSLRQRVVHSYQPGRPVLHPHTQLRARSRDASATSQLLLALEAGPRAPPAGATSGARCPRRRGGARSARPPRMQRGGRKMSSDALHRSAAVPSAEEGVSHAPPMQATPAAMEEQLHCPACMHTAASMRHQTAQHRSREPGERSPLTPRGRSRCPPSSAPSP